MRNIPNEYAVMAVEDYISSIEQIGIFYGYSFQRLSYSRGAAIDILKLLKENKHLPPLIVIENFQAEMKRLSEMNPYTSWIFSVSCDVAASIIDDLTS